MPVNLRSTSSFWPIESGLIHTYPILKEDQTCQVAIIGAGITGALVAYHLSKAGISCVVVDERDIGGGSTSASTGLLQYEVDTPLTELAEMHGEEKAVRAYRLCFEAITKMEALARELGVSGELQSMPSLFRASSDEDVELLNKEFALRRKHNLEVDFWEKEEVENHFPFSSAAALWSSHSAQVNPYRFAHALLGKSLEKGARIYDRSKVKTYESHGKGVTLTTETGQVIEAGKVVFATGYVTPEFLNQKIVSLNSTYALISEPGVDLSSWYRQCLIWETKEPYLYLRTTPDGRVIVGGEDEKFKNPKARDMLIEAKTEKLLKQFRKLFPDISLDVAYSWAGTFGSTKDGLGYIGENKEFPNGYFALGYGGNGIVYSVIAAELICDLYHGRPNPDLEIFSFDR